jgi:hypothetical protein
MPIWHVSFVIKAEILRFCTATKTHFYSHTMLKIHHDYTINICQAVINHYLLTRRPVEVDIKNNHTPQSWSTTTFILQSNLAMPVQIIDFITSNHDILTVRKLKS